MIATQNKSRAYVGFYHKMREYLVEKSSLFGIIRWQEVIHTEKVDNELILDIVGVIPTKLFINDEEYFFSKKEHDHTHTNAQFAKVKEVFQ